MRFLSAPDNISCQKIENAHIEQGHRRVTVFFDERTYHHPVRTAETDVDSAALESKAVGCDCESFNEWDRFAIYNLADPIGATFGKVDRAGVFIERKAGGTVKSFSDCGCGWLRRFL